MVAWREYGAMYWVHSTLTYSIEKGELLATAGQTVPITAVPSAHPVPAK